MSVPCNFFDFGNSFGYYKIDNRKKYFICVNPHDNRIYEKSAHYRWENDDTDDEVDLPTQLVKLLHDNIGCETMLNASVVVGCLVQYGCTANGWPKVSGVQTRGPSRARSLGK